jgi:hypothetical protein
MKRGRNQRRRQGVNPNRALDSNGPEVRIRGTANQVFDKYITLARDASSSGDRVKAENYLQHAEHYFRMIRAMQPSQQPGQPALSSLGADQPAMGDDDLLDEDRRGGKDRANGADHDEKDALDEENGDTPALDGDEEIRRSRRRRGRRPTRNAQAGGEEADAPAEENAENEAAGAAE